jgi:hypothetical protein
MASHGVEGLGAKETSEYEVVERFVGGVGGGLFPYTLARIFTIFV